MFNKIRILALNNNKEDLNEDNNSPKDENMDNIYISRYTQYTMHEFNSKVVNMIVVYFNQINSLNDCSQRIENLFNKYSTYFSTEDANEYKAIIQYLNNYKWSKI